MEGLPDGSEGHRRRATAAALCGAGKATCALASEGGGSGGNIGYMTPEQPDAPHAAGPSSSPPPAGATPLYEHDCDRCVFLGTDRKADLYFCDQRGLFPTVLARFADAATGGDSGSYLSGIPLAMMAGGPPELAEALRRARAAGLLPTADATAQGSSAGSGGRSM